MVQILFCSLLLQRRINCSIEMLMVWCVFYSLMEYVAHLSGAKQVSDLDLAWEEKLEKGVDKLK